MKPLACILVAVLLLTAGCGESHRASGEHGDANGLVHSDATPADTDASARVLSSTLVAAWGDFLAEAVIAHKNATGQFPPHTREPNYPAALAVQLQANHEWVFLVSPHREKQFQRGEFDEADVAATLDERITEIRRRQIPTPWLTRAIIRLRRQDKLSGASLVLARRVVDAELMDVINYIRRQSRSQPANDPNETR